MEIAGKVKDNVQEDIHLEYKAKGADNQDIALELTALANASGGTVVLGVREDANGRPNHIQHIENIHERSEGITNVIYDRVEPNLEFELERLAIDGNEIAGFTVAHSERLHSFSNPKIGEPVYPVRRNTRVAYLHGHEIAQHYEEKFERPEPEESSEGLLRLSEEDLPDPNNFFIKAPDGHISDICLFSDVFYPEDPHRIYTSLDYLQDEEAEHALAVLDNLHQLSVGESYFTINQSNGAWIGKGFSNFVSNLRNQSARYEYVENELGYELDLYGNEQAVFISNLGQFYPESLIILYAAPFADKPGYRHFTVNWITEGVPVDVRALVEVAEQAGFSLSTANEISIPTDGLEKPSRLKVDVAERRERSNVLGEDSSVDGALCGNPFYDRIGLLESELDLERLGPITKYQYLYGNLLNWDSASDPHEYETERFVVRDWHGFTRGIYGTVQEVNFLINW